MVHLPQPSPAGLTNPSDPSAAIPITVVIPAFAATSTLPLVLRAIASSHLHPPLAIKIVYDGEAPYRLGSLLPGHVAEMMSQAYRNAGLARNTGASQVFEGIIVFIDADVAPDPGSIATLLEPLLRGEADAAVGNYSTRIHELGFCQQFKQLYIAAIYSRHAGPIRNEFWSAFGAITAQAFHAVGGFSGAYSGAAGEDTELGHRLTRANYRITAVPQATALHLHKFTVAGLVRNDFRKGTQSFLNGLRNRSLREHRHSSPRDILAVAAVGALKLSLLSILLGNPFSTHLAATFLVLWIMARFDLLRVWGTQGILFLARALPLAFLLDLVRGLSVITALTIHFRSLFPTPTPRTILMPGIKPRN